MTSTQVAVGTAPPAGCLKVFVQRDYSEGTSVKYNNRFPPELEGKVKLY